MSKFPDFIIVSSMKCGTTAMWHNLNKHPKINMGKNRDDPKKTSTEIRFWTDSGPHFNFKKGIDWYKSLFDGECCGEKDADLIRSRKAMKLIAKYIPNVKLILLIRNPIDRAYSEFQMNTRMKNKTSFIKSFKSGYWERGLYLKRIKKNIIPYFPRENLHISVVEWMKKDTDKELNKIYKFLGLQEFHAEVTKQTFKQRDTVIPIYKNWDSGYKPITDRDRKIIYDKYKNHNEELFKWLGYDIKEWRL